MTVEDADDARQGIQSVEVAMAVLRALEEGRGPMSLTQIAAASGMGPSKVHRYLVSLRRAGMVTQVRRSGLYDLGSVLRRLGMESLRRMDEVGLASAHVPGLRDRTTHAVNLAVWGDRGPVVVRWDYGSYALPMTVRLGATLPLLSSAVGHVYLAHLADTLTDPVLRAERAERADTAVDTAAADAAGSAASAAAAHAAAADAAADAAAADDRQAAEVAQIRAEVLRDGVATVRGGVIPGVLSVAAPVFTAVESLPLVVAVAMPMAQAGAAAVAAVAAELRTTSTAMSAELGHGAALPT